jgi:hypothetical protein
MEAHRILLEPSLPRWKTRSTMGPLRALTEPIHAWGNLQNLIGGSQLIHNAWDTLHNLIGGSQELSPRHHKAKKPQSLGKSPQLYWRSPSNTMKPLSHLRFQEPESNKLLIFTATNLQTELKPMQWQEHTKCSNPSLPKSTKATNAIWEIWEEEQWRKSTNESKI